MNFLIESVLSQLHCGSDPKALSTMKSWKKCHPMLFLSQGEQQVGQEKGFFSYVTDMRTHFDNTNCSSEQQLVSLCEGPTLTIFIAWLLCCFTQEKLPFHFETLAVRVLNCLSYLWCASLPLVSQYRAKRRCQARHRQHYALGQC